MEVEFPIKSERNVREAFVRFSEELGYKVIESKDKFPDFVLEDEEGKKVRAEAELFSSSAKSHELKKCDLVICWHNNWPDCPVDVLELDKKINTPEPPEMKWEVVESTTHGDLRKKLRLGKDENSGNVVMRIDWWEKDGEDWKFKSVPSGSLDEKEFRRLFEKIPEKIRKKVFVDLDLKGLWRWHRKANFGNEL